jgi:hypothetical protein
MKHRVTCNLLMTELISSKVLSTLQRKSHVCMYSFSGNCATSVPCIFHIHVSVSDFYIPRIGPHISCGRVDRSIVEYKNRSQTNECGNRDCGRAIPFLGIFVLDYWYWILAVQLNYKSPDKYLGTDYSALI